MVDTPQTPQLPSDLPVVPIRGAVVLPLTVAPLGVNRPMSVEAINRALAGDRMVLLLLQHQESDDPAPDDLHRIGTVAIVRQMAKAQNGMRVLVEGIGRAKAEELTSDGGLLQARLTPMPESSERSVGDRRARPPPPGAGRPRPFARYGALARHQGTRREPGRPAAARLPPREPARHEGGEQAEAARRGQRPREAHGGHGGALARDRSARAQGQDRIPGREGNDRRAAPVPAAPADEGHPDRARRRGWREPGAPHAGRRGAASRSRSVWSRFAKSTASTA